MTKHTAPNLADGLYVWKPPNRATASVAVQSRWGNLYDAPAAVRSLAVDVCSHAYVFADIAAPETSVAAGRLPGPSLRLRAPSVPAPPFTGCGSPARGGDGHWGERAPTSVARWGL